MFDVQFGAGSEIRLAGRLDAAQAERLEDFLKQVDGPCVVDCAELRYISSAGLSVLLAKQQELLGGIGGGDQQAAGTAQSGGRRTVRAALSLLPRMIRGLVQRFLHWLLPGRFERIDNLGPPGNRPAAEDKEGAAGDQADPQEQGLTLVNLHPRVREVLEMGLFHRIFKIASAPEPKA